LKTHYDVYSDPLLDPLQNKPARILTHTHTQTHTHTHTYLFKDTVFYVTGFLC